MLTVHLFNTCHHYESRERDAKISTRVGDNDAAVILKDVGKETELDSDTQARHCDFNRIPSRLE